MPFRGPASLSGVHMAVARTLCVILIPFRLPQISCFTLSLGCFSSVLDSCPDVRIWPLFQFPHPPGAGPVLLTLLFSVCFLHPSEFCMLYIFFSSGQVLLPALCWCSARSFVSEGVFLMYLWREIYSMSAYSSTILFSLAVSFCRESSQPWDWTCVSCTGKHILYHWAREAPGNCIGLVKTFLWVFP